MCILDIEVSGVQAVKQNKDIQAIKPFIPTTIDKPLNKDQVISFFSLMEKCLYDICLCQYYYFVHFKGTD